MMISWLELKNVILSPKNWLGKFCLLSTQITGYLIMIITYNKFLSVILADPSP